MQLSLFMILSKPNKPMRKVLLPAGSLIMNGTPAAIWKPLDLNLANMVASSVYDTTTPGASNPLAATDFNPLLAIILQHSVPRSHASCLTLSKPTFSVAIAARSNKVNASVGMVV